MNKTQKIPPEFQEGLKKLAAKLQVQVHEESTEVTLEACKLVVEALVTAKDQIDEKKLKLMNRKSIPVGFDTGDEVMNEAG